jgi:outer membrane murein-binding lipoprotein Lpp
MNRKMKLAAALVAAIMIAGCATAAGGLVGAGIGRAAGDTTTGVLIGTGVGMMIDIMN